MNLPNDNELPEWLSHPVTGKWIAELHRQLGDRRALLRQACSQTTDVKVAQALARVVQLEELADLFTKPAVEEQDGR